MSDDHFTSWHADRGVGLAQELQAQGREAGEQAAAGCPGEIRPSISTVRSGATTLTNRRPIPRRAAWVWLAAMSEIKRKMAGSFGAENERKAVEMAPCRDP